MGVMLCEQETSINMYRDSDIAEIYTPDTTVLFWLDKLVESPNSPEWKCVEVINDLEGNFVGKRNQTKKKLISFRSAVIEREYTKEQKQELRERIEKMQAARKEKRKAKDAIQ